MRRFGTVADAFDKCRVTEDAVPYLEPLIAATVLEVPARVVKELKDDFAAAHQPRLTCMRVIMNEMTMMEQSLRRAGPSPAARPRSSSVHECMTCDPTQTGTGWSGMLLEMV